MKNSILFLSFLFLVVLRAQAQDPVKFKIRGVLLDSLEGTPLVKAAVLVDFKRSGTLTDDQGRFELTLFPGDYWLSFRLVGYRPNRVQVHLDQNKSISVRLNNLANELEEVIITSKAIDGNTQRPILGVNQLNIKNLQRIPAALGEVDILRGIQMLPGVTSVGEAANGVNIRGGTSDQNLMLLDETPIFNPTHMFGLFSAFPPDAISSLEIYKGNAPARYGGRAAAVLDVTMTTPNLETFTLNGGVSVVSNRLQADIPVIKNKLGIIISGRGALNDFLLPVASERLKNIKAKFGDAAVKLFYRMDEKNTFTVSGYWSKDFFQTDLLGTITNVNATATQYDHRSLNVMGRWFHAINSNLNIQATITSADYVPKILLPEKDSDNRVIIQSGIKQQQVKVNLNYLHEKHKWEAGISATKYKINPGELKPGTSTAVVEIKTPLENSLELAVYAEDEVTLTNALTISAGLRYSQFLALGPAIVRQYVAGQPKDDYSVIDSTTYGSGAVMKTYGGLEPRLGLKYSLNQTSSLKFGYSLMRQYIQVVSNTTTPLPTSRWKTSDTHIKPQVSHLVSGGYFHNFKEDVYELSLEGYYRHTQNIIDYKPGADFLLQRFPETQILQGVNRSWGIEMMLSKKRGELTGWTSYTFSRSQNRINQGSDFLLQINNGNWYKANYDRPHNFNTTLNINQGKYNSFSFNFVYSTGRPYTSPSGTILYQGQEYPFYTDRNEDRLPAYHRLDFSWYIHNPTMKNKRWVGTWAFTVYNLYARKNAYSVFYRTEDNVTNSYKLVIFGAPIVSLAYNFKFK
ncbi:MAG: TonB-dependent receptor [Siphonobacter sp.]